MTMNQTSHRLIVGPLFMLVRNLIIDKHLAIQEEELLKIAHITYFFTMIIAI